jgi:transcriptional regulator with XRE-family HTH domain
MTPRNIIGPQLRKLRNEKGMSQQTLAELLQRKGWDVSRGMIARIEGQVRWISDFVLLFLSDVLGASPDWFLKRHGNAKLAARLVMDLHWRQS